MNSYTYQLPGVRHMACTSVRPEGSFFVNGGLDLRGADAKGPVRRRRRRIPGVLNKKILQTIITFPNPFRPERRLPLYEVGLTERAGRDRVGGDRMKWLEDFRILETAGLVMRISA